MTEYVLPYCPAPMPDELLSSWIERIGLFYGVGLAEAMAAILPGEGPAAWETPADIDADPILRKALIEWTGVPADRVPQTLPAHSRCYVERAARLAYCPCCCDEDIARGDVPYVRASWARWFSVSCPAHSSWLCARYPRTLSESHMTAWAGVWRSNPRWAAATYQRYEPALVATALAFEPRCFAHPRCGWKPFHDALANWLGGSIVELDTAVCETRLASIVAWNGSGSWYKVRAALQEKPLPKRVEEFDIVPLRRPEPQWIGNRITGVVMALELAHIQGDGKPLFDSVRALLGERGLATRAAGLSNAVSVARSPSEGDPQSHECGQSPADEGANQRAAARAISRMWQ